MPSNIPSYLKVLVLIILFVTFRSEAFGDQKWNLDKVSRAVVFFSSSDDSTSLNVNKRVAFIGTGFIVNANDFILLITAEHVAKKMNELSQVIVGSEKDKPIKINIIDLMQSDRKPSWVFHHTADVAAMYIKPKTNVLSLFRSRAIPTTFFTEKMQAPSRNRPLTVIGFPLGLGVLTSGPEAKISPISKESKAASGLLTLPRFDTKTPSNFYLLDSPSVGGFSGSPVFVLPGSYSEGSGLVFSTKVYCVGLIHGTISDNTGGKFAAVVPCRYITDTIKTAFEYASRNQSIN